MKIKSGKVSEAVQISWIVNRVVQHSLFLKYLKTYLIFFFIMCLCVCGGGRAHGCVSLRTGDLRGKKRTADSVELERQSSRRAIGGLNY